MNRTLDGRVALVTGAASGIGAATAELLSQQGATTYRADLAVSGSADRASWQTAPDTELQLDVREETDWDRATATVLEREGRLDILVHCAGIAAASPLADTSLAEWRRVMATNLDGAFLATRHGIRAMGAAGGAIVLVGSVSGIQPSAGAAAYSTSKAGVGMLARAAAKECRELGLPVRVNAVSPGGVKTPLWEAMPFFRDLVEKHGSSRAAFEAMEAHGGDRFAEPEQVARAILFLVSDAADHVTGVELPVDDGYTV
ncbi:MAG: SDR family oxidoreductase [marine benthic group bacterium]|nr:SDR family oxidoreductase [Candidatus Benthicola marisminoris]